MHVILVTDKYCEAFVIVLTEFIKIKSLWDNKISRKQVNCMNSYKKIISYAMVLCIASMIFSGCVTDYEKSDIEKEISENIGVKNAIVFPVYTEFKGEDGYTDRIWTAKIPDSGIEFHVIDDYHWGMESVTNYLKNDYDEAVLAYIETQLPKFEYIKTSTYKKDGIFYGEITGKYENLQELKECHDELENIKKAFVDLGYDNLQIAYQIEYVHPLRNVTDYVIDDGDTWGNTKSIDSFEDMKKEYITTVLDYRYEDLQSFSPEEIKSSLDNYMYPVGIYRGNQTDKSLYDESDIEYYDDIIANKYAYGISFGSLYEILKRENMNPEGDYWHYSFTGADGSVYEISYDFNDYPFTDSYSETRNGYYYIKDGEKVPMNYYFYNHFTESEVYNMTGLNIIF